mgnify:CR=1 FL=1
MAKGTSSFTLFNGLMDQLNQNIIAPVYLLHGEEYHFLEKVLDKIEEVVLDETTKSFNHHVFYGKDSNVLDIINVSRRYPMMADYQLVVVKEAQYLSKPDLIMGYLENPMPNTVLVWYHPGKKLPMNRKPGPSFKKHTVFLSEGVSEKEIDKVVTNYLAEKGYDIEPRPLHLLIENSAGKFSVIVKELDKVFSNLEKGNKIREEHIEKFVGINKEYNIFSLQKALAFKNKEKVVEIMMYFSNNLSSHPLPLILGTLFSYFRKVAIMQSLSRSTDKEIMSTLRIPFFAINEFRQAASNYRGASMQRAMKAIHDCDLKFKGIKESTGKEKELFEETLLKILAH